MSWRGIRRRCGHGKSVLEGLRPYAVAGVLGAEDGEEEGFGVGGVAEAAEDAVRDDDAVERLKDYRLLALVAPVDLPAAGEGDEGLLGAVAVEGRAVAGRGLHEVDVVVDRLLDGGSLELLVVGPRPERAVEGADVPGQGAVEERTGRRDQLAESPDAAFHLRSSNRLRLPEPRPGRRVEVDIALVSHVPAPCISRIRNLGSRPLRIARVTGYRSLLGRPALTCQFFYRTRPSSRGTLRLGAQVRCVGPVPGGRAALDGAESAPRGPGRYPAGAVDPAASLLTHSRNAAVIGSSAVASGPTR